MNMIFDCLCCEFLVKFSKIIFSILFQFLKLNEIVASIDRL